jgi:hypothetical protein
MSRLAPLAAVILLAGCGDSSHPTVSARVVSAAAAKTTRASTARFSEKVTGSVNGRSLGEGSSDGAVDGARRRGDIRYDLGFLAKSSGNADPDSLKGRIIVDGDNAFATGPAILAKLPAGRSWVEVTIDQVSDSGSLADIGAVDPVKPVDQLRAVVGDAELLGTETVNGVPAKHYRTEIDYRLYISLVPRKRRAALAKGLAKINRILSGTRFPVEAWIASDGTIRREKGILEGHGLRIETTLDLTAIGKPVRITQPARIHVLDARKPP